MAHCVSVCDSKKDREGAVGEGGVGVGESVKPVGSDEERRTSPNATSLVPNPTGHRYLTQGRTIFPCHTSPVSCQSHLWKTDGSSYPRRGYNEWDVYNRTSLNSAWMLLSHMQNKQLFVPKCTPTNSNVVSQLTAGMLNWARFKAERKFFCGGGFGYNNNLSVVVSQSSQSARSGSVFSLTSSKILHSRLCNSSGPRQHTHHLTGTGWHHRWHNRMLFGVYK